MAARYEPFDWYQTPLYYDIVFDLETERECDFLEAVYARWAVCPARRRERSLRVLEPACGSGRLVLEMARRGHRVAGLDISPGALGFARTRLRTAGQRARLVQAGMESFDLGTEYELAHCLVSSFRYLLSEDDAHSHLAAVADALVPGGIYVLGLHLCDYDDTALSRERHVATRDDVRVVCNIQAWPPKRRARQQQMRARLVVHTDAGERRYQSVWRFRTYGVRQLTALLAKVSAFEHVATYDFDYDLARTTQLGSERYDQVLILRRR